MFFFCDFYYSRVKSGIRLSEFSLDIIFDGRTLGVADEVTTGAADVRGVIGTVGTVSVLGNAVLGGRFGVWTG